MRTTFICSSVVLLARTSSAFATTYEVGPGKSYPAIGDVPWESLAAGDRVLVYPRMEPYREKWAVGGKGTAEAPIVVRGVPGANGELPIIDGTNATTRQALSYWGDARSILKIGGSDVPANYPSYITVENLDISGGLEASSFTDDSGNPGTYAANAASIFIENGDHITIRGCKIHGSSNGLFVAYESTDVLIDGNYIYDNGRVDDIYKHNSYTEAMRITYENNRFGPLCEGCPGNNLKDRSAGTVIRTNWIEGGNRQLDLVDSEYFAEDPAFRTTYVYGNVLIEPEGAGNRQIVHYGGDNGVESLYRKGALFFHFNTVISHRSERTTLFRLSSNDESADIRNNLFYVTDPGHTLALLETTGQVTLSRNWFKPGWVESQDGAITGSIAQFMPQVEGVAPAFVDEAGQDFRLAAASTACDVAGPLSAALPSQHTPSRQYVKHQSSEARLVAGTGDLGAFESTACGPATAIDAGQVPETKGADGCGCHVGPSAQSRRTGLLLAALLLLGAAPLIGYFRPPRPMCESFLRSVLRFRPRISAARTWLPPVCSMTRAKSGRSTREMISS